MLGALAPWGMPLATEGWSGERADDGCYIPILERMRSGWPKPGLRFVGDWTMSALSTRASGASRQHFALSPLPCTGTTAAAVADGSSEGRGHDRAGKLARLFRSNDRGAAVLAAAGSEGERPGGLEAGTAAWSERVLVVRSPGPAERQAAGLETRLAHAEQKLAALTPARGRGKRPITAEATRLEAMAPGLNTPRGEGFLSIEWTQQSERHTPDGGRGRGSATRAQRVTEKRRSHMTRRARREGPMADRIPRCGGKALGTHATPERLSLADAVLC
jgi:transposase